MPTLEDLFEKALRRYKKDDFESAEPLLRRCIEMDPNHAGALYRLGEIEWQRGHLDIAFGLFERVRTLDPTLKNIGFKCAQLQVESGQLAAALESVEQHLRLVPDHGAANGLKGYIEGKQKIALAPASPVAVTPRLQRGSWGVQKSVLFALLMRNLRARVSIYRFGYVWIILEPVLQVSVLFAAYIFLRAKHSLYDVSLPVFLIMGVVPWLMFRNVMRKNLNVIESDRELFDYRQVRPLDLVLAVWLEETLIYSCVYVLFLAAAAGWGLAVPMHDPLLLLLVFMALYTLSLGCALIAAIACELHPTLQRLLRPGLRLLHFISGVFFTIDMIPDTMRLYLLWNPLLHALDLIKAASVGHYQSPASWLYLWLCALGSLCIGLMYYRRNLMRTLRS